MITHLNNRFCLNYNVLCLILLAMMITTACAGPNIDPMLTAIAATPASHAAQLPTQTPAPSRLISAHPRYKATFEAADCQFREPLGRTVDCGFLTVPEDRSRPNGATIRLHVAIFPSQSETSSPDPIVYLAGGPGSNSLESIWLTFKTRFEPLTANRDFIIFDQRGTGLSVPALDCPEVAKLNRLFLEQNFSAMEESDRFIEAAAKCQRRLTEEGINLAAYNSAENAADLNDLRRALGYQAWNLYGTSYGTRLALTAMRENARSSRIRSVVLDSAYPPQADLYAEAPANANRAFQALFTSCLADTACQKSFPDLEKVFIETIARLDQTPATVDISNPITREQFPMVVGGDDLLAFLFSAMYATDIIPMLPQILYEMQEDNFDTFAYLQGSFLANEEFVSRGMYFSVQCHEEASFSYVEDAIAAAAAFPDIAALFEQSTLGSLIFNVCDQWGAGHAKAIENEAVYSHIPTLILAGDFDPITPPSWGKQVAETLSQSTFVTLPTSGHGGSFDGDCQRSLVLEFLESPASAIDTACLTKIKGPQFLVSNIEVTLVPFTEDIFQLQGVVPSNWDEIVPGVYGKGASAILQQAGPPGISADLISRLLLKSLEVEDDPQGNGTYETNGLIWTLYELEIFGATIDLATTESEGRPLIVLLQVPPYDQTRMRTQVFFPALDALQTLEE